MKHYISIGGINYEFKQLHFGRIVGLDSIPFSALVAIAKGSALPTYDQTVIIQKEINGTLIEKYRGKVTDLNDNPTNNGMFEVSGFDLKRKIEYQPALNEGYASQKGSSIFSTEIAPSSVTDLTAGTVDAGTSGNYNNTLDSVNFGKSTGSGNSRLTRKAVMEMLQMMSDADIYVKKSGIVDFVNGAGVDRSSTHILIHGENGMLSPDMGYKKSQSRRVKQVIVKGNGVGSGYHFGSAGTPASTDKKRQVEISSLVTDATCGFAAQSLLSELDQEVKFAKFILKDVFQTDYDVYDTVKLKAVTPLQTVNENLKIFSIDTVINATDVGETETTTLQLANFRRGGWAKLANPFKVAEGNEDLASLSLGSTQVQTQVENAGGSSFIQEDGLGSAVDIVGSSSEVTLGTSMTFNSTKTAGGFIFLSLLIVTRKFGLGSARLQLRFTDGTNFFPTLPNVLYVRYDPFVGMRSRATVAYHIPNNLASKTLQIKAQTFDGEVEVTAESYFSSIGEHKH